MITTSCKKATQAINYFAHKKDGTINKMKVIKLIYLADRYHLRKYGRPIVGDKYWAMKLGPVGSEVLNIANLSKKDLNSDCLKYVRIYLDNRPGDDAKAQNIISKQKVDLDVFSQTDIDAFETVFKEFGDKDQFELAQITHEYPEWIKFKPEIEDGKKRVKMDYEDFFANPKNKERDVFAIPIDHLKLSKEIFKENQEVFDFFS